jgi:hypothetical protein
VYKGASIHQGISNRLTSTSLYVNIEVGGFIGVNKGQQRPLTAAGTGVEYTSMKINLN